MNASKENAAKAKEMLEDQEDFIREDYYKFLLDFVVAAARKLPKEESIIKNKMHKLRKSKS